MSAARAKTVKQDLWREKQRQIFFLFLKAMRAVKVLKNPIIKMIRLAS